MVCGCRLGPDDAEVTIRGEDCSGWHLNLMIAALPSKIIVLIGADKLS